MPSSHPQYITFQQELKNKEAGDFAEQYILKELQKLPQLSDCHLFLDVILPTILPMQMDRLIITASGIVILEMKNIRGTVHFKNNPRRTNDKGEVQAFTHPEIQLEQYIQAMHHFPNDHNMAVPIYGAIVFPFNNVAIHRENDGLPIVTGRELLIYLYKIIEKNMGMAMNEITNIILSQLQHRNPFPLCRYYQLEVNALQRAVYCENCGYFGMEKLKRTWFCRRCQHQCTYAYIQALKDYYMLVGHTITNRECRAFLMLECKHVTKRLLQKILRTRCNSGKLTKYDLSSLLETPLKF